MESLVEPNAPGPGKPKAKSSGGFGNGIKLAIAVLALAAAGGLLGYQLGWFGDAAAKAPKVEPSKQAEEDRLRALAEAEQKEWLKRREQLEKARNQPTRPDVQVPVPAGG